MLQGSTYNLRITMTDKAGVVIDKSMVKEAVFTIGDIVKTYGENGEVTFQSGKWIVPLTEQETFSMKGNIKWQARFLFTDGSIKGMKPKYDNVDESIDKTILSEV
jgi:hypothetical protein